MNDYSRLIVPWNGSNTPTQAGSREFDGANSAATALHIAGHLRITDPSSSVWCKVKQAGTIGWHRGPSRTWMNWLSPQDADFAGITCGDATIVSLEIKAYDERSKAAHKLRAKITDDREYNLALLQLLKDRPLPPADVRTVVNHIEHIIKIAGIDHVGLGSNFDGMGTVPRQLEDVSCFPQITQELLNRGHAPEAIRKVLGGNMLRVLRTVEAEAVPQVIIREQTGQR